MKTVNYKEASIRCASLTDLCTSWLYCSPSDLPYYLRQVITNYNQSSLINFFCSGISVIDKKIYVLGGEEGWDRYHDTIECYDPEKDEWNIVGKLLSPRSWLGCVPLKVRINLNFSKYTKYR